MNIETIIFCNTFGIILLIMLLGSGHLFSKMRDQENRLFLCIVLVAIIGSLFEMVSFLLTEKSFLLPEALTQFQTLLYIWPILFILFSGYCLWTGRFIRIKRDSRELQ